MKKICIIFSFWLFLIACEKEESQQQDPSSVRIEWLWHARIPGSSAVWYRDPSLYKDWVILGIKTDYTYHYEPVLIAFDKKTGHVAWQYTYPGKNNSHFRGFIVAGEYIILKYTERLVCLHAETRKVVWETVFPDSYKSTSNMEIHGDYLYQAQGHMDHPTSFPFSDSVSIVRYQLVTGLAEKIYGERTKAGTDKHPELFPPVIYNDGQRELAIFQRYINYAEDEWPVDMVAVDVQTKKVVWRDTSFSPDWGSRLTPPRILDGNVIACSDHSIYSWNASTGKRNWKKALFTGSEKISFTTTGPFIHDGKIFVFEFGGHGFCLNPENGQTLWETYTTIQKDYGPAYGSCLQPIIVDDILLVNAGSSRLFLAYDARNGHLLHQFKDATYNGTNLLFDEETGTCFVLADEKLKAFTVER